MSKSTAELERAAAAAKRKELQARDGAAAMAEYEAGIKAERKKTEKLRELRLAREARDAREAKEEAAAKKAKAAEILKAGGKAGAKTATKAAGKAGAKSAAKSADKSTDLPAKKKKVPAGPKPLIAKRR